MRLTNIIRMNILRKYSIGTGLYHIYLSKELSLCMSGKVHTLYSVEPKTFTGYFSGNPNDVMNVANGSSN
jgi:hypothetical protein